MSFNYFLNLRFREQPLMGWQAFHCGSKARANGLCGTQCASDLADLETPGFYVGPDMKPFGFPDTFSRSLKLV